MASSKRVPAEWEPQAATWLQWPGRYEKMFEPALAEVAGIISRYQKVKIVYDSDVVKTQATEAISAIGANPEDPDIEWLQMPNDNAWMRDNGPVYLVEDGALRIQNWSFNAWGGAFGSDIPWLNDDRIPDRVGKYLGLPVDRVEIVHERGDLEFNGVDSVILNWSTIGDPNRNPGYTREQARKDMQSWFGVSRVVLLEGVPEGDLTRGHVDGFARFIDTDRVVVSQYQFASSDAAIYDDAARTIEAAGFRVIRDPILKWIEYKDKAFATNYLNWLVGNGFVIAVGFGDAEADCAAKTRIEGYFPGRDVFIVEMLDSWYDGGGVHCHTNDQPAV